MSRYNTKVSKTRVVMERAYGMLKNRWRILLKPIEIDIRRAGANASD